MVARRFARAGATRCFARIPRRAPHDRPRRPRTDLPSASARSSPSGPAQLARIPRRHPHDRPVGPARPARIPRRHPHDRPVGPARLARITRRHPHDRPRRPRTSHGSPVGIRTIVPSAPHLARIPRRHPHDRPVGPAPRTDPPSASARSSRRPRTARTDPPSASARSSRRPRTARTDPPSASARSSRRPRTSHGSPRRHPHDRPVGPARISRRNLARIPRRHPHDRPVGPAPRTDPPSASARSSPSAPHLARIPRRHPHDRPVGPAPRTDPPSASARSSPSAPHGPHVGVRTDDRQEVRTDPPVRSPAVSDPDTRAVEAAAADYARWSSVQIADAHSIVLTNLFLLSLTLEAARCYCSTCRGRTPDTTSSWSKRKGTSWLGGRKAVSCACAQWFSCRTWTGRRPRRPGSWSTAA
jgi:hypothetical protein